MRICHTEERARLIEWSTTATLFAGVNSMFYMENIEQLTKNTLFLIKDKYEAHFPSLGNGSPFSYTMSGSEVGLRDFLDERHAWYVSRHVNTRTTASANIFAEREKYVTRNELVFVSSFQRFEETDTATTHW